MLSVHSSLDIHSVLHMCLASHARMFILQKWKFVMWYQQRELCRHKAIGQLTAHLQYKYRQHLPVLLQSPNK